MHDIKQFVLLSGGLDSTVVLYHAIENFPRHMRPALRNREIEAVSIDYGQRHAIEMQRAAQIAGMLGVQHTILKMPDLLAGSMLTSDAAIPEQSYADLPSGISPTYVPFRNGLMISMLAAYAQKWVMAGDDPEARRAVIYIGAHSEDAENDAYPDCSPPFLRAMQKAVEVGTYESVIMETPLMSKTKAEVVGMGVALRVSFGMTWSCYKGETLHCGKCPTCRARKEAFEKAGVNDPTQYAAE
jgi:7-cyano-7-deazaguanine synthase